MPRKPLRLHKNKALKPAQRRQLEKNYALYRKLGLPAKQAYTWAFRLAKIARDHWGPPKCGW